MQYKKRKALLFFSTTELILLNETVFLISSPLSTPHQCAQRRPSEASGVAQGWADKEQLRQCHVWRAAYLCRRMKIFLRGSRGKIQRFVLQRPEENKRKGTKKGQTILRRKFRRIQPKAKCQMELTKPLKMTVCLTVSK